MDNSMDTEQNEEIKRVRKALVEYLVWALSPDNTMKRGEVDGQIFPAAVDLFTYLLEESRNRIS